MTYKDTPFLCSHVLNKSKVSDEMSGMYMKIRQENTLRKQLLSQGILKCKLTTVAYKPHYFIDGDLYSYKGPVP
jgi:hypothetical protein